jgi:hypothetical protein
MNEGKGPHPALRATFPRGEGKREHRPSPLEREGPVVEQREGEVPSLMKGKTCKKQI